jgi:alkylhydroperoxidase family enzyme
VARRFRPIPVEERRLSDRDQELAILRLAWLTGTPFVWGEHVRIGKKIGMTGEEIERVTLGSQAPGWSPHDAAVLRAVEELHGNAMISDATWAALAETLDAARLVELPILIGQYQALAYLQNSLRVPLWDGNDGLASR